VKGGKRRSYRSSRQEKKKALKGEKRPKTLGGRHGKKGQSANGKKKGWDPKGGEDVTIIFPLGGGGSRTLSKKTA